MEKQETKQKIKLINYYYRVIEPRKIKEDIKNGTIKKRKRSKANYDNIKMRLEVVERKGFTSRSGVMRGHGKTPNFRSGMKCLPHRHVLSISAANNCMRPIDRYII